MTMHMKTRNLTYSLNLPCQLNLLCYVSLNHTLRFSFNDIQCMSYTLRLETNFDDAANLHYKLSFSRSLKLNFRNLLTSHTISSRTFFQSIFFPSFEKGLLPLILENCHLFKIKMWFAQSIQVNCERIMLEQLFLIN